MMFAPLASAILGSEYFPSIGVNGTPFTSPETTSEPTLPLTTTVSLAMIALRAGVSIVIEGAPVTRNNVSVVVESAQPIVIAFAPS